VPDIEETSFNRGTVAQLSLICEFITKQAIPITLIGCELSRAGNETTALPVPLQPTREAKYSGRSSLKKRGGDAVFTLRI
jgi:hypothetical protein